MNAITPNINYFAQYAEAASANQIEGKLLKFSKGDWTYGVDGLELPAGIRLVALMNTLTIGWQRWFGGKPTDTRFGLVANGYQPPNRQELGDQDSSLWEADANGDARDPWAFVNRLVLIHPDDSAVFTFSTSSRGGINAIGELCKKYSRAVPGKYPLVSLEVGSYSHSDRSIGKVKFPTFNVVEYVDAAPFDEARRTCAAHGGVQRLPDRAGAATNAAETRQDRRAATDRRDLDLWLQAATGRQDTRRDRR